MDAQARNEYIVRRLQEQERVDVAELATSLATSEMTIRRDLETLATAGVLRRVHGGAVSLVLRGQGLPFEVRRSAGSTAKQRIARVVEGLVYDGEAVVVDSGTTALACAEALAGRRITTVPLSLPAANVLASGGQTTVKLAGGTVVPGQGSLVGPLAETTLRSLRLDTAIVSCCGVSVADGVMAFDDVEAATKRTAIAAARRTVLVADAEKFTRSAFAVVAPMAAVDIVVTDAADAVVQEIEESGVEVRRA